MPKSTVTAKLENLMPDLENNDKKVPQTTKLKFLQPRSY